MNLPLFLVPILSGLVAQALKPFFNKRRTTPTHIPRYGGMPSAHTAFAVSLVTMIGMVDGILNTIFALAIAFMIYTLDDALRMRIFIGKYGQALKHVIKKLPEDEQKKFPYVEQRLGHTLPEVLMGAIVGFIVSFILVKLIQII